MRGIVVFAIRKNLPNNNLAVQIFKQGMDAKSFKDRSNRIDL